MAVTMRAVLIKNGKGPAENLYIGNIEKPSPNPGEVLVKVKAFGLNRMDILQREGHSPPPPGASRILGVEFSGVISDLASGVTKWSTGDEVIGLAAGGAYAEFIVLPQTHLMAKPKDLSWVEAASIPENWITAFQAVVLVGQIKAGNNALVHGGASGVGVASIQIARAYNATDVIATASTQEKLDWLLSLPSGATHAVNYKTQDFSVEVDKITKGKGVDVVVDIVGQSHWHKNIKSLAVDGRMTMLAFLSGTEVSSVDLAPILNKRLKIQGSTLRNRSQEYQADLISKFQQSILQKITGSDGDGPFRTYIYKVYSWWEIQDAHRDMEANKNLGKIVVEIV